VVQGRDVIVWGGVGHVMVELCVRGVLITF
jgi:hypothetical protein